MRRCSWGSRPTCLRLRCSRRLRVHRYCCGCESHRCTRQDEKMKNKHAFHGDSGTKSHSKIRGGGPGSGWAFERAQKRVCCCPFDGDIRTKHSEAHSYAARDSNCSRSPLKRRFHRSSIVHFESKKTTKRQKATCPARRRGARVPVRGGSSSQPTRRRWRASAQRGRAARAGQSSMM